MKDLIDFVARAIVEHPDAVEVTETGGGRRFELCVADEDMGRIIGRRGRTAQAMRTVLRASADREDDIELEIVGREGNGAG